MAEGSLQIGPLQLRAPTWWKFYPFEHVILARASRRGSLQITLAYAKDVPADAGHEACVNVMQRFMNVPVSEEVHSESVEQNDAVFGFVTFHDAKVFQRYWYRYKNGCLVLSLFQCAADSFTDARNEIEEAGAIAATMELVA